MLTRDALTHAICFIRSATEDATMLRAAKVLENKAGRMRARTEKLPHDAYWCECGAMKPGKQVACSECYALIPMRLLVDRLTGKPAAKRSAERKIRIICETRMAAGERMAA